MNWIKKHKIITAILGIVILLIIIGNLGGSNTKKGFEAGKDNANTSQQQAAQERKGTYSDQSGKQYQYTVGQQDSKYAATFDPLLPRDDATVIGAMLELANTTYGKNTITNLQPQPVEKDGKNLIMFESTGGNYYFLLVKQDTGEVHSISYWKE